MVSGGLALGSLRFLHQGAPVKPLSSIHLWALRNSPFRDSPLPASCLDRVAAQDSRDTDAQMPSLKAAEASAWVKIMWWVQSHKWGRYFFLTFGLRPGESRWSYKCSIVAPIWLSSRWQLETALNNLTFHLYLENNAWLRLQNNTSIVLLRSPLTSASVLDGRFLNHQYFKFVSDEVPSSLHSSYIIT